MSTPITKTIQKPIDSRIPDELREMVGEEIIDESNFQGYFLIAEAINARVLHVIDESLNVPSHPYNLRTITMAIGVANWNEATLENIKKLIATHLPKAKCLKTDVQQEPSEIQYQMHAVILVISDMNKMSPRISQAGNATLMHLKIVPSLNNEFVPRSWPLSENEPPRSLWNAPLFLASDLYSNFNILTYNEEEFLSTFDGGQPSLESKSPEATRPPTPAPVATLEVVEELPIIEPPLQESATPLPIEKPKVHIKTLREWLRATKNREEDNLEAEVKLLMQLLAKHGKRESLLNNKELATLVERLDILISTMYATSTEKWISHLIRESIALAGNKLTPELDSLIEKHFAKAISENKWAQIKEIYQKIPAFNKQQKIEKICQEIKNKEALPKNIQEWLFEQMSVSFNNQSNTELLLPFIDLYLSSQTTHDRIQFLDKMRKQLNAENFQKLVLHTLYSEHSPGALNIYEKFKESLRLPGVSLNSSDEFKILHHLCLWSVNPEGRLMHQKAKIEPALVIFFVNLSAAQFNVTDESALTDIEQFIHKHIPHPDMQARVQRLREPNPPPQADTPLLDPQFSIEPSNQSKHKKRNSPAKATPPLLKAEAKREPRARIANARISVKQSDKPTRKMPEIQLTSKGIVEAMIRTESYYFAYISAAQCKEPQKSALQEQVIKAFDHSLIAPKNPISMIENFEQLVLIDNPPHIPLTIFTRIIEAYISMSREAHAYAAILKMIQQEKTLDCHDMYVDISSDVRKRLILPIPPIPEALSTQCGILMAQVAMNKNTPLEDKLLEDPAFQNSIEKFTRAIFSSKYRFKTKS